MKKLLANLSVIAFMAVALGCEEAPPSELTETTILAIEGPQGDRVEVAVPIDLTAVETALYAANVGGLGGLGGGNLFSVEMLAGSHFQTNIEGAMGSFVVNSGVGGGFSAVAPVSPSFSATGGCDLKAAVCQFGTVACQYLPQLAMKFAEPGSNDLAQLDQATCVYAACGGANELLDLAELPAGIKCAASGILSCVSAQLPSVVNVLMGVQVGGDNSAAAAALEVIGTQLATCLGPYAGDLSGLLQGGSAIDTPQNYDEW